MPGDAPAWSKGRRGDRMNDRPAGGFAHPTQARGWRQINGPLFRKYVGLFVLVVSVALLANGLFELGFAYQDHRASLIRIQRGQAELGEIAAEMCRLHLECALWSPWSPMTTFFKCGGRRAGFKRRVPRPSHDRALSRKSLSGATHITAAAGSSCYCGAGGGLPARIKAAGGSI